MQTHVPKPSGDQTPEQARHFAISSFEDACQWDGLGAPDRAAIDAELARRDAA